MEKTIELTVGEMVRAFAKNHTFNGFVYYCGNGMFADSLTGDPRIRNSKPLLYTPKYVVPESETRIKSEHEHNTGYPTDYSAYGDRAYAIKSFDLFSTIDEYDIEKLTIVEKLPKGYTPERFPVLAKALELAYADEPNYKVDVIKEWK